MRLWIKSQLASRNQLQGLMRCRFGHVTCENLKQRSPLTPPGGPDTATPRVHSSEPQQCAPRNNFDATRCVVTSSRVASLGHQIDVHRSNRAVAGKLGRFNEKHCRNLNENPLDGPIACHVLVKKSRFLKMFLVETVQVFPQPL